MLRYVVLTITLTLATISPEVLAVYPTLKVMVEKGQETYYHLKPSRMSSNTIRFGE